MKIGQKIASLHANMNFLANGSILLKNARKQTPLKIQFYFQVNITLPTSTISKAKKRHCFFFMSNIHSLWLLAGNLLPDFQIALTHSTLKLKSIVIPPDKMT